MERSPCIAEPCGHYIEWKIEEITDKALLNKSLEDLPTLLSKAKISLSVASTIINNNQNLRNKCEQYQGKRETRFQKNQNLFKTFELYRK